MRRNKRTTPSILVTIAVSMIAMTITVIAPAAGLFFETDESPAISLTSDAEAKRRILEKYPNTFLEQAERNGVSFNGMVTVGYEGAYYNVTRFSYIDSIGDIVTVPVFNSSIIPDTASPGTELSASAYIYDGRALIMNSSLD